MRLTLIAAGVLVLAGCGQAETNSAQLSVVASHYPVQFLVDRVGGDYVKVESLTSPGTEPHDVELSPQQVGEVQQADAVFYLSGFQPAVDSAVAESSGTRVDLLDGLPTSDRDGQRDPHVWLDPVLMAQMAGTVGTTLAQADPEHAEQYQQNARELQTQLGELNSAWKSGTADCAIPTMVVSHEAFGYLADEYGFTMKGISGLSPDTEPSAQALAELAKFVKDQGVTTVYTESLVDPAVAETVAAEADAKTATLDPLEGPPATGDYLTAMQGNLQTVQTGQSCT